MVPTPRAESTHGEVVGEWKRRGRIDPRAKSRKIGRPRKKWLWVDDPRERARLQHLATMHDPKRVSREWRFESMTRSKAQILAEAARAAYAEWFEALDDPEGSPPR